MFGNYLHVCKKHVNLYSMFRLLHLEALTDHTIELKNTIECKYMILL